jgi:SAM-dependent MidA family methyltransferase
MALPQPDPEALALSRELAGRIARSVEGAGGWIGFDAWMQQALYAPGLGYYSGPLRKFGAAGDFVTASEMSPLFAACVARQVSQWFAHAQPAVVEFGAGSGVLAAGLLEALRDLGTPAKSYRIVEVSGVLRERQRETIARLAPGALDAVEWLDALPEAIDGVVIGNELLDAMPVRLFEHEDGRLHEVGVALDVDVAREAGSGAVPDRSQAPAFRWGRRPAGADLERAVVQALEAAGDGTDIDVGADAATDAGDCGSAVRAEGAAPFARLGPGRYRSEVCPQAQAWVATVGRALVRGALLLVDYGFPAREYYHPQRDGGTLIAHYRHHAHGDVLRWPGLQDLTAHVDFSAVSRAAREVGLAPLGYVSQARFLVNCGLLDLLAQEARAMPRGPETPEQARRLGAVQALLSEAEMGELFKAIAFGRGMPDDALGFARGDRSGAL